MWEAIRANRRRTLLIFIFSSLLVTGVFYMLGEAIWSGFGPWMVAVGLLLWGGWALCVYHCGGSLVLRLTPGRKRDASGFPPLGNVVEEMKIAAGLERVPRIVVLEEDAPNAFALGCRPDRFTIVVTTGLIRILDRDELQGVIAHEVGHMINGDSLFLTFAGILLGVPVMAVHSFQQPFPALRQLPLVRWIFVKAGQGILFILSLVFFLLAPFVTRIFYFSISRTREFLADATAVRLTRYPSGLAGALKKISTFPGAMRAVSRITAPMCTVNPLQRGRIPVFSWFRTHPDTEERIRVLTGIGANVDSANDNGDSSAPVEQAEGRLTAPESEPLEFTRKGRGWQSVTCSCGAQIQISPFFRGGALHCGRCGKKVIIR